ncbi:MAG TPA: glycoside hydrolase family 9 protein [Flavisolibacter sp.]|nr:glycoside hydrolase family 9 protein [Flavisolibacter sp.]
MAKRTLLAALLIFTSIVQAQQAGTTIYLNQVGFYPSAPKWAFVSGASSARFFVLDAASGDTVYRGTLGPEKPSLNSSLRLKSADFSGLKGEGRYLLVMPGGAKSHPFQISSDVHRAAAIAVLKGFYFQRSNGILEERFAGRWQRPSGHPDTAVLVHPSAASENRPAGTTISSPGGWYDAGDYNKYIVNSGITMGTLFSAYEDFPAYYKRLNVGIPESSDAVPDILNEALYNLRWMMTMQDPHDGGVYHKLTNASFDGMVMPGVTKDPRFVVQKGTAATLDFAAVMAQGARVLKAFEKQLPGLSDSCLRAAASAWNWATKNPNLRYSQSRISASFQPAVSTGEYGDSRFGDEWLWAAAELFVTTNKRNYFDTVVARLKEPVALPSWGSVEMLGYYTLVRQGASLPPYVARILPALKDSIIKKATQLLAGARTNAFGTPMGGTKSDFVWGSSAVAANQGILLLNAYRLTKRDAFLQGALANADYLLGRNATGFSFVTGIGSKTPMHPHHRPSVADGIAEPVPGLLSGGPNPGRQDSCKYAFTEPETAFTDDDCSYASNEIAINWNAPAVYLFNAVEAILGSEKIQGKKTVKQ